MKYFVLTGMFLISQMAFGLVDMKNANYANTWIDMDVPGSGYDLKIVVLFIKIFIVNFKIF